MGWPITATADSNTYRFATAIDSADAGIEASVGSKGDSYDNALAGAINSIYKAVVIYRQGPWKSREAVELATLTWVDWFQQASIARAARLRAACGVRDGVHDKERNPAGAVGFK
jgi:transposase InsO family protein